MHRQILYSYLCYLLSSFVTLGVAMAHSTDFVLDDLGGDEDITHLVYPPSTGIARLGTFMPVPMPYEDVAAARDRRFLALGGPVFTGGALSVSSDELSSEDNDGAPPVASW